MLPLPRAEQTFPADRSRGFPLPVLSISIQRFLIFDDSFSALDYRTDRTLRGALKKEAAGVTKLIVAQRIGTIKDADRIIVVDDGRIAGQGTHKELLENCEVYKEIAESQLSKEELLNA